MKSRKLLALTLALCLMFGVLAPAAGAIQVAGENIKNVVQGENASTGYDWLDNLLVSTGKALGLHSMRDEEPVSKPSLVGGKWVVTAADGSVTELKDSELPAHVQALKKAAEEFKPMDKVIAFVTLESDPTADLYSSIHEVPEAVTAELNAEQDALIAAIEQNVLGGQKLSIVSRFTHLTNSVVIETEFVNLETIASLAGVKSVFLSPTYEAAEVSDTVYPATESSTVMTNVASVWQELGYTGTGMTIAILDTGLDVDHPSFAADPEGALWNAEWLQEMLDNNDLRAEELYTNGTLTAENLYYNAKIPFTFDYARGITSVVHNDGLGDHGTHVAGIAAANKMESTNVVGMAPDAQIIAMKVFSPSGGASMYTIIEALQDCMILGVDVANLSLGSASGFSESNDDEINAIFRRISESDLIVDVAAGNEGTSSAGSKYGYGMQLTDHIENGTMASPATYANSVAIGSVDNNLIASDCFELADGTKIAYMYSIEYIYMYIDYTLSSLYDLGVLEYYVVDGLGYAEEFYDENGNSLVAGKVALIPRGEISFNEKIVNAEAAGAVAAIIWNTDDSNIFTFGMTTSGEDESIPSIPVGLITLSDGQKMADAETKTLFIPDDFIFRVDPYGGQMSSFSCWGTTSDLRLLPDLSGVGGSVYSTVDGGYYGVMSGTSMASPQVAGVTALVLQYLREAFPDATEAEIRVLVDSLLMSTAVTVIDVDSGVEASPRQQGAGLVDVLAAITAEAYLSVEGSERPKAELKDNVNGEYSFTFTVHNYSDTEKTYQLRSSLLAEDVTETMGLYFLAEQDRALDNAAVTFSRDSVTVAAGGSEEITVTIKLTEEDKQWIDTYFPNGNYVEGYVYLEGEDEVTLSLPFMGFYGEWDDAPVFDTGFWYDDGMWLSDYYITANQYDHYLFTSLGASAYDWVLGMNAYTGPTYVYDEDGMPHVYYDPSNNVISPNGDGAVDSITEMYLSLMRNAAELEVTYTDAEGNVLDYRYFSHESKTMYYSSYGQVVPFIYSWTYSDVYDFAGLEDGDVVYLTISAVIDYEGAEEDFLLENMPIYIDTTAPVLDTTSIVESSDENGNYITLTFAEEHPAAVITMNSSGSQIYDYYSDLEHMVDNGDGTYTVTLDVTDLGDKIRIAVCDYGCNEAYYDLTYTLTENNPEMDTEALYAYQVYHEYFYYYYGWDAMFGWSTIDKLTAESTMISSDQYEYYALTAAEYVDDYVFAVDAGGNLIYMVPGIWNRNMICNLGLNVIDMAFDETTGTMYLATSDADSYSYCLYTVDLLTGETTMLRDYYSSYSVPWAMTFVDGKLYCTKYYYGGLYEVDLTNGTYDLNAVTDAEGNAVAIKSSGGSNVRPYYAQSMTYSEADGVIYWAYYNGSNCELITIDPTTWTNTATAMYWDQEFVGVLTLEDDGYTLPESNDVTKVVISDEQVILGTGKTYSLTATALPWNAPESMREIIWSSSNETVATVNANGVVSSVSEGTATITAFCNGFEASCEVIVVDISGSLNAYKYYDGSGAYGYWLDIDLATNTEQPTVASPVDFIAADYNGHNGLIYGYSEVGQCYWFNPVTGEYGTLGVANTSVIPADMAYDYSTGTMYVLDYNENYWTSTLYTLNMSTGKLVEVATTYDLYITLACSPEGQLYTISYDGILYELHIMEDMGGGGGIMPLSNEGVSYMLYPNYIMQTPVSGIYYAQTMCYDANNDAILWLNPETAGLYWLGGLYTFSPYCVALGDPSGTGVIQYTGAYVIPENIEPLPYVPVQSVEADDVLALAGSTAMPSVNVYPANATNGFVSEWESVNPEIAYVDESGMVVGVAEGSTTIYATVIDIDEAGNEFRFEVPFNVTVKNETDNIYGYLIGDLATGDGLYWAALDDVTTSYQGISYAYYEGAYMTIYAAEYVDGMVYAYGYNAEDWNANFYFMIIDANSWLVTEAYEMTDGFPFVYDMAFDYTAGVMYAVAGPNDSATDLYYVNMATGELIEALVIDPMIMSLTVDANGTIYGMAASEETFDPWTWETTYGNAILYTLDPVNGTYEVFMDTGVQCNMLASMAYDHDTGYIYWTGLFRGMETVSGLYLIDLEEQAAYNLGSIGGAGAQVTGLMIIADEYPEQPTTLQNLVITTSLNKMAEGDQLALEVFQAPFNLDVEMTWTSADESVATVDENGVVTAVSAGTTTITVTAFDGENTKTASCTVLVYGSDDFFVTYDQSSGGFTTVSRPHGETTLYPDAEGAAKVTAMASINGIIFAYDEDEGLFYTSVDNGFERTYIGNANIELEENYSEIVSGYYNYEYYYEYTFTVRDLTWDAANNRLLALGCYGVNKHVTVTSEYYNSSYTDVLELMGGCRLYEVNLETGELEELLVIYSAYGDPYSGVTAMAMTPNGLYIYSTYMDYISLLDLQTGVATDITTFQNLGLYGESGASMAMSYDEATNSINMLFTQNGRKYFLYSFDIVTTILTQVNDLGTVTLGGLIANEEHVCDYQVVWETEDGFVKYQCLCGDVYVAHNGYKCGTTVVTDPTCTKVGYTLHYCPVCDEHMVEHVPALGHTYEVTDSVDPTCTEDGYITYTCAVCDDSYTDVVPMLGHTAGEVVVENVVDPTCTTEGSYDNVVYCTVCGEELSRETVVVDALGHTAGEVVVENVVDPTCTTEGSYDNVVYCTVCGEELSRETVVVDALGHTEGEVVVENVVDPTCTTEGSYDNVIYCTVCGEELSRETVVVDALGHTEGEVVVENVVDPTCTTEGSYDNVVYCTVCGEELSRETVVVDALGHTEGEVVVENIVDPTCTTEGSYDNVVYCTVCGEELSRETVVVPVVDHNFENGACTDCGEKDPNPETGSAGNGLAILLTTAMLGCAVLVIRRKDLLNF